MVETEKRKDSRPRRNRDILMVLYHTGIRVSELCELRLSQYKDRYLHNIKRKGKICTKGIYLSAACRRALDDFLENERPLDDYESQKRPLCFSFRCSSTSGSDVTWREEGRFFTT